MVRIAILLSLFFWTQPVLAADAQWVAVFGRGTESADTDIFRLAYRQPLK